MGQRPAAAMVYHRNRQCVYFDVHAIHAGAERNRPPGGGAVTVGQPKAERRSHMPTRRKPKPAKAERPKIEDQLLRAMEQLLAEGESFSAVSIERLTAAAGLARATFYLHFRDKAELVTRLMGRVREEIVASAGLWFEHAELAQREDMRTALHGILGVYQKHHVIIDAVVETEIGRASCRERVCAIV